MFSCLPVLLYGLEACPLNKSAGWRSIDFVFNKFFMKLFQTSKIETAEVSQFYFGISLPSVVLRDKTETFEQKYLDFVWSCLRRLFKLSWLF